MLYLYLDESGDLGFDFFSKKPSKYFTIAILAIRGVNNNRVLLKSVRKTIRRKLCKKSLQELKGSHSTIEVKRYFYNLVSSTPFDIYALTLNKKRVYNELTQKKDRVYNFIARNVLDRILFDNTLERIEFIIDKSKNRREIGEFNNYIVSQLKGRLDPRIALNISHHTSIRNP